MKSRRLANKIVIAAACVLALVGLIFSGVLLLDSLKYGVDWYRFLPAVLYVLCFIDLIVYATTGVIKSPIAFRSVLVNYGLVVILTGVIFPPVFPMGTKWFFIAGAALIALGLIGFSVSWAEVKRSKIFLTFAFVVEIATAIAALNGNPMMMDGNLSAQLALFIRPVILGVMAVCYLARMYEKSHQE